MRTPGLALCRVPLRLPTLLWSLSLLFGGTTPPAVFAQEVVEGSLWPRSSAIYSAPEPFTLSARDALQARAMIWREGFLIRRAAGRTIVVVEELEIVPAGRIEELPETHRDRYDLLLNREPLPWDELYLPYGGKLTNLRLLFTYRNQRPVPDLPYRIE